ncbi:MAG: HAMP domain-containing sensor histidine kinase [Sulfurovum sp.]
MSVYLVSVFILLLIIGYLFFENSRSSMQNAMKFEMMYKGHLISSSIIIKAMNREDINLSKSDKVAFLKSLAHKRFKAGYYDKNKKPIYTEIKSITNFDKPFFMENKSCCSITEDKSNHLGIRYVILKEYDFIYILYDLGIKILTYLIFSFLVMGMVGYFLGRLFMLPIREQIESLDNFISDTTHELNTPISAILMTISSLKGIEPKKLRRLEASAKRLSVMYSSLTYRLEGKIEPSQNLAFGDIINQRVGYVKELIESKKLDIRIDIEPTNIKMPPTSADRLIDNLLSNAIKYSDIGDSINISLRDNILVVQDSGIGIEKEVQDDIFQRYHRANDERGGFGIGLNIVLSICKEYNIKLELNSTKGEGSIFTLRFPSLGL